MSSLLDEALRAGHGAPVAPPARRAALVIGGGGPLGSAVLEAALGCGLFSPVRALVDVPMATAMRGFEAVPRQQVAERLDPPSDTAFIVFDRVRGIHGRELALHRPEPQELAPLGAALFAAGVRRLVVVLPHAPALLPQALRQGLASLDEQALAALGFEQLVFVRPAQSSGPRERAASWLQRVAAAMLAQLHWMVPLREQPVRPASVAALAMALARQLPQAAALTRVVPPELVWQSAQAGVDVDALVADWLAGREPPLPPPGARWHRPASPPPAPGRPPR